MDISSKLNQTAVYWGTPVATGYGGYSYASPVEISVRWEDRQELFINIRGQEELSRAIVYAEQDVSIGGYMYLGEESDLDSSHDDPEVIDGAFRIEAFYNVPGVDGSQSLRKILLGTNRNINL